MVRIFDRRKRKPAEAPPAAKAEPPPAAARAAADGKVARVRRAPSSRPPRRDWAAEAAATPIGAPIPLPSSLASSPGEDGDVAQQKRRRGTRGGRGRKKPGAESAPEESVATADDETAPAKRRRGTRGGRGRKKPGVVDQQQTPAELQLPDDDMTIEAAVARQARALELFAREMQTSLRSLHTAISDLQGRSGNGIAAASTAHPRVGIFVDVPNLIYAAERRNLSIDFGRVLEYFTRGRQLVRAGAYAPISDDPQVKLETQRFVSHFVGHPYRIITKPLKRFADGSMKANFDIELAIDILTMSDRLDVVVLMSGDGDFRKLVELISSRGVRVEVAAFSESVSSELKTVADLYVDIGAHLEEFKTIR